MPVCNPGGGILQGRHRVGRADNILQGRRRKGLYGENALWRNKVCSTDKEAMGREEAGGRPEYGMGGGKEDIKGVIKGMLGGGKDSLGSEKRRDGNYASAARRSGKGESQRPITEVGRAVGQDCRAGARRQHTEVRSSYHFRVRTKVNSTTVPK
ncbi:hypothetical protein BY996DRAFT_6508542 [Phakopsora pachyrhizi]|nr:hypothetical protein BY996DRAFT_6508542 [Phakopsora pachyrhizi]